MKHKLIQPVTIHIMITIKVVTTSVTKAVPTVIE